MILSISFERKVRSLKKNRNTRNGENMTSSAYTYQADGCYLEIPKKRFSILNLLSKMRRFCIFVFLLLIAYEAWPKIQFESYLRFREMVFLLTNSEAFEIVISSFKEGFMINPMARCIEATILLVCIWKLVFRGKLMAFLQVKSIVMLALASFWIHLVLFEMININAYPIWGDFISFFTYSPMLVYLYPFGIETALEMYAIAAVLIVCYIFTVLFYGTSVKEGERLTRDEMEQLGINEVMKTVNPIRKFFLPRPRFYITDSFSQNAYSSGRNIVIASNLFNDGVEVVQGVIGHELGHYYHYDTDASLICNVAINTVVFPLMAVTFLFRIVSHIPFLGIFAGIYGIMLSVLGLVTGLIFSLVNIIFYWIDGKWAERSADMFSIDLGVGFGNYLFLSKFTDGFSLRNLLSGLFDVHPGTRSRCRYIKKRIIRNWGEDYWDSLVAVYGDYYV